MRIYEEEKESFLFVSLCAFFLSCVTRHVTHYEDNMVVVHGCRHCEEVWHENLGRHRENILRIEERESFLVDLSVCLLLCVMCDTSRLIFPDVFFTLCNKCDTKTFSKKGIRKNVVDFSVSTKIWEHHQDIARMSIIYRTMRKDKLCSSRTKVLTPKKGIFRKNEILPK